ncbi:MAG: hypothetical protein KJ064_07015 [Anaerolineae bacterium]|nr:hypothetical protein [Anaerolineae bacterium]
MTGKREGILLWLLSMLVIISLMVRVMLPLPAVGQRALEGALLLAVMILLVQWGMRTK